MTGRNLLDQPETLLPAEPEVVEALRSTSRGDLAAVVAAHPTSSLAWAVLAEVTHAEGRALESYAYARVGYHRGLDALRRAGWRGSGPVPWRHEPNRGVLRALYALRRAAAAIGETDEVERLTAFLEGSDPTAIRQIESMVSAPASARTASTPTEWQDARPAPGDDSAPPTEAFVIRGED